MTPVLSTRNSMRPFFSSAMAAFRSKVTVPVFGFGIKPLRPDTIPRRPTFFHHVRSGDGDIEIEPAAP